VRSAPPKFCRRLNDGTPSSFTANLAVDDRFVGKTIQGSRDGRESLAEILSVTRGEMRAAIALDSDAAVAVELELQLPLLSLRQFRNREAEHRFEKTRIHWRDIVQGAQVYKNTPRNYL